MAGLDEGVVNLQRFVAALATATGALETIGQHIEASAQKLVELQDHASEDGGQLNDQLEDLASALDREQGEACDGLDEVAQAATAAQGTVAEAIDKADSAASHVESRTQA